MRVENPHGLPGPLDQDVYTALLGTYAAQGMPDNGLVRFERRPLLTFARRSDGGQNYHLLHESLTRLLTTSVRFEYTFLVKGRVREQFVMFHLVDRIAGENEKRPSNSLQFEGQFLEVRLPEPITRNLLLGISKWLDLSLYFSLKTPSAKRLYRLLDSKRSRSKQYSIAVNHLAAAMPLARLRESYVLSKMERAHDDLVKRGYLRDIQLEASAAGMVFDYQFAVPGGDPEQLLLTGRQSDFVDELSASLNEGNQVGAYRRLMATVPETFLRRALHETLAECRRAVIRSPAAYFRTVLKRICADAGIVLPGR